MCPRFWELGHGGAKVPEGVIWQDIGGTKGGPRDSRVTSATGTVLKAWPQAIPHLHTLSIVSITYTNTNTIHKYKYKYNTQIQKNTNTSTQGLTQGNPSPPLSQHGINQKQKL